MVTKVKIGSKLRLNRRRAIGELAKIGEKIKPEITSRKRLYRKVAQDRS